MSCADPAFLAWPGPSAFCESPELGVALDSSPAVVSASSALAVDANRIAFNAASSRVGRPRPFLATSHSGTCCDRERFCFGAFLFFEPRFLPL